MIKEKHLVPGRVLAFHKQKLEYDPEFGVCRIDKQVQCMVISYIPLIKRRHARSEAQRDGWNVLVFWLDDRTTRIETLLITPAAAATKWWILW